MIRNQYRKRWRRSRGKAILTIPAALVAGALAVGKAHQIRSKLIKKLRIKK